MTAAAAHPANNTFADTLELLGHDNTTLLALCSKPVGQPFLTLVNTPTIITATAATMLHADTWFSINHINGPARTGNRGGADQITRLAAIWADLDIKPGACPDLDTAHTIIDDLSAILETPPSIIIESGHGLQPIWPLDDGHITTTFTQPHAAALLKRWGRMVAAVAGTRNTTVDSVFDLPRILRVPGTVNHKHQPVPTNAIFPGGAPLSCQDLSDRLDEYGVNPLDCDQLLEQPLDPATFTWADDTCAYVKHMINAWNDDWPDARHPWLLAQTTRLAAAKRNSCITETDHKDAITVLDTRMRQLCAADGNARRLTPYEIKDALAWGEHRMATVTDDHLLKELGAHTHDDDDTHIEIRYVDQHVIDQALANTTKTDGDAPFQPTMADNQPDTPQPAETPSQPASGPKTASPAGITQLVDVENGFWEASDVLNSIYLHSLARMSSPWAVLGVLMCRALSQIPPWITLPPVIGGRGSLNFFTAITAHSGGGKGAADNTASELLPLPDLQIGQVGSGEGLAHYYARRKGTEYVRTNNSVHFTIPEIDTLAAVGMRQGSTLMSKLREAYSGESLEFGYADPAKRVPIGAHTYRLTLSLGVQASRAAPLLDDAAGGTPQRFIWMPASDQRISRNRPRPQEALIIPHEMEWGTEPHNIPIPRDAENTIIDARVAAMQGDSHALDGHSLFTREKAMIALAALHNSQDATPTDWELAGIIMNVSDWQRQHIVTQLSEDKDKIAEERGRQQGIARVVAEDVAWDRKHQTVARWLHRKLPQLLADADTSGTPLTVSAVRRMQRAERRDFVPPIIGRMVEMGLYQVDPDSGIITEVN